MRAFRRGEAKVVFQRRSEAGLFGQYPPIGDRPGQCLVSYRFETRIGRADKAKPIQTKKFAIHTLGHELPFAVTRNQVCNAAVNRRSALNVGNAAVCRPGNVPGRTHALCQKHALAGAPGYFRVPTKGDAALISLCARVLCRSGHRVRGTPSAEIMPFLRGG